VDSIRDRDGARRIGVQAAAGNIRAKLRIVSLAPLFALRSLR
jgi:hypothetical protein